MDFDIIIRGGLLVDGTGSQGHQCDLGIKADRIVAMGPHLEGHAQEVIDADGMVVAPGFIDTHSHSEVMLLAEPQHERGLRQGITTEILGQDGLSYAPLSNNNLQLYRAYLAGLNGNPDINWDWSSVAEYRSRFDGTVAINTIYLIPHGTLRLEVLGMRDRPLVGEPLERAKALLRQGFEEGAAAFSTGLSYYPGAWSNTEELIELGRVAAEYGRPYVTHLRTVFREPQADYHRAGVEEALEIGRQTGVPVHFSHFRTSPATAGCVGHLLGPIREAMAGGLDITLETYPYSFGSGYAVMYLPPWAQEGGVEYTLQRLSDPVTRQRIRGEIAGSPFPPSPEETCTHVASRDYQWAVGHTFREIGERLGTHWLDALLLLMLHSRLRVGMKGPPTPDPEVEEQITRDLLQLISLPYYMVGSDSIPTGESPHPRAYGCFPRFLRLAREYGYPELETLIHRMTELPARRFGLRDRGVLALGKAADVVVFDPMETRDCATFGEPKRLALGVRDVLVNGQLAIKDFQLTGCLAGRALSPA